MCTAPVAMAMGTGRVSGEAPRSVSSSSDAPLATSSTARAREDVDGDLEGRVGGVDAVENRVRHVGGLRVFAVLEGVHLRRA